MPITFTKEEIRMFLREQGYDIGDEPTLKKFIKDLKRLIKFEEMKRRRRKLGHPWEETNLDSTDGRHGHTTTTTTSTSFGDENQDSRSRSRQYQSPRSLGRGRSSTTGRSPEGRMPKSPGKSRESEKSRPASARRPPESGQSMYRPEGRGFRGPQERADDFQAYDSDESSSRDVGDDVDTGRAQGYRNEQRQPLRDQSSKPPVPGSSSMQRPAAPLKKQGNRLIMRRFTASQDAKGESVIEESDIDLGPVRRSVNYRGPQPSQRPPTTGGPGRGRGRPQTAPAFGGNKPPGGVSSTQSRRPIQQRPTLSRPDQNQEDDDDECDTPLAPEDDELFHALNELIFPGGQLDSQDSLFAENDKPKTLLKPPQHVAIDPVALYHWYKTYNWDVYSIPGEDRHMKLRWNVRAKTVGGYHPCVEIPKYKPKYCGC